MMSPQPQQGPNIYPNNTQSPSPYPPSSQNQARPPSGPPNGNKAGHIPINSMSPQISYSQAAPTQVYQQPPHGYNSSPAPTERRLSRQGPSGPHTPGQPTSERQGAAAAAAAAMAAAAHSAQPGTTPTTKPQAVPYYHQNPPAQVQAQQPQTRPPYHGNNDSHAATPNDTNMYPGAYSRMPHPGTPNTTSHMPRGHPGVTNSTNNMHRAPHHPGAPHGPPQNHYGQPQHGYPNQGSHPNYYPGQGGDPSHMSSMYPSHPHGPTHQPPEEPPPAPTPKRRQPAARSASQKLQALYEPQDEPGRREFIDSIIKYWEDKDLPLKNAPLMGRKTLDLFTLYRRVKERGFMQEVSNKKKWPEISNIMNLGSTSTSGFTLKKQYCKYLYGYECRMERGEEEPTEALQRVTEANRKKKQLQDQHAQKQEELKAQQNNRSSMGQSRYPNQMARPYGQYPPYGSGPPQHGHPYNMSHQYPPANSSSPRPPQPGHPIAVQYPQSQHMPPGPNYLPPSDSNAPSSHPPGAHADAIKHEPTNSLPPSNRSTPVHSDSSLNANSDPSKLGKPFNEDSNDSTASGTNSAAASPMYKPRLSSQHIRPQHDMYRPSYQPRPGMPSSQYQYPSSPAYPRNASPHPGPSNTPGFGDSAPRGPGYPNNMHNYPGNRPGYQAGNAPNGMKRPSGDGFGPPSKYPRPDGHPTTFANSNAPRHPSIPYISSNSPHHPGTPPRPPHGAYPPGYPRRGSMYPPRVGTDSGSKPMRWPQYSPRPGIRQPYGNRQMQGRPSTFLRRKEPVFPPGSVEATQPKLVPFQRKSCREVGNQGAWKLIMSLKSGLLGEASWALNALTVLLYDAKTVSQLKLPQLPGLLDCLIDHYRTCLSAFFTSSFERQALGLPEEKESDDEGVDCPDEDDEGGNDEEDATPAPRRGRRRKAGNNPNAKYGSEFTTLPIKVEQRTDPFISDVKKVVDDSHQVHPSDDFAHIVVTFLKSLEKEKRSAVKSCKKEANPSDEGVMIVEATLEDVLSIPTTVLSFEDDVFGNEEDISTKPPVVPTDSCKTEVKTEPKVSVSDQPASENKSNTASNDAEADKANNDSSSTTVNSLHLNEGNPLSAKPDDGITSPNNLSSEKSSTPSTNETPPTTSTTNAAAKSNTTLAENNNTSAVNDNDDGTSTKERTHALPDDNSMTSITSKVEKVLRQCNLVLLESEAVGCEGSTRDALNGPILMSKKRNHSIELSQRLLCICNIIRSLSFIPSNASTLFRHQRLMRAIAGSLLLRHKHRRRGARCYQSDADSKLDQEDDALKTSDNSGQDEQDEEGKGSCPEMHFFVPSCGSNRVMAESVSERAFCSTLLAEDERTKSIYDDPWWWDCVHQIREDALVTLCNIAHSVDLSELPDDHTALVILESCLHWSICQSSDAIDPFSHGRGSNGLSPRRISLEILTKLSLKDGNVDLILATRPFSRIEKLFATLVSLICDRKDQTLREFAIVLLSNLASGDVIAARAIALQKASISGLIAFLEECEETGVSNRRLFAASQGNVNCGTTPYMMTKCAKALLSLAQVPQNKQAFIKYQLRLLSLSMSQFIGDIAMGTMSSVIYELNHESTT